MLQRYSRPTPCHAFCVSGPVPARSAPRNREQAPARTPSTRTRAQPRQVSVLAGADRRADQDAARCDRVAVVAPLRRSHHPRAVGRENQVAHVHALGLLGRSDEPGPEEMRRRMTVGEYAGVALQDPDDNWRHGAVLLLQTPPRYTESVSLEGWTTTVVAGERAVITRGPSNAKNFAETLDLATGIANRGLDYLSVTGRADCAIREATDDCLVWWRDRAAGGVVVRCRMVPTLATDLRMTMHVTVTDPNGVVQPSPPPPTPMIHDAFRFIRMSRTADDLYDSYRNLFLAFECLLSDIRPQQRRVGPRRLFGLLPPAPNQPMESETAWFKAALGAAEALVALGDLTPDNVTNHKRWIFKNMYEKQRCALMHAKQGRRGGYFLPQGQVDRGELIESMGKLSWYISTLIEAHLQVRRDRGTFMSIYMKGELSKSVLREHEVVLSDDPQPLILQGKNFISHDATTIELVKDPPVEDPDSPGVWTSLARCDPADLHRLNGVRKFGAKPVNGLEAPQAVSELAGPVTFGSDVKMLEVQYGHRIANRSEPRSAFTS
jgi:hypothetical protein